MMFKDQIEILYEFLLQGKMCRKGGGITFRVKSGEETVSQPGFLCYYIDEIAAIRDFRIN